MMLRPFRIHSLYDTSPGVVQLTGVQYDGESQPDAALLYLDEDDGETILVGSSLELQQRLDEPVPSHAFRSGRTSSVLEEMEDPMHIFDINKTPASLAIWREHEAYTSKALRKSSPQSLSSSDLPASPEAMTRDSMSLPVAPQRQTDVPVNFDDAIKEALRGLETRVGAFTGFLQDTSNTLRTVAEHTREADANAVGDVIEGLKGIFSEVGKVGKAMVEAFDADAFALSPRASQEGLGERMSKKPDTERGEVVGSSNRNSVSVTGSRQNVHIRTTPLAEADSSLEPTVSSHASFAAPLPHDGVPSLTPEKHRQGTAKLPGQSRVRITAPNTQATPADKSTAPFPERDASRRLYPMFSETLTEANSYFSAHTGSPGFASSAEASQSKTPTAPSAPFVAYASLKDPWKISSERASGRYLDCSYCQRTKTSCRRSFSGGACQTCVSEQQPCSFVAEPSLGGSRVGLTAYLPNGRYHPDAREPKSAEPVAEEFRPSQQLNAQHNEQVQLPRETAKTYAQSSTGTASRSILDLENSDPDFSTRYPPLMSLRKSKTIASLTGRSRSPFLANTNPEVAISRFPSLSQIEHQARSDRRVESLNADHDVSSKRWNSVADSQNVRRPLARPRLVIPARPFTEVASATRPKLPGAWPEPRAEADGPTLPTSEESSGAFFDRVTRSRSPEPAIPSFRYIPAHLPHSRHAGIPFAPHHQRDPSNMDPTHTLPPLRQSSSIDTMPALLGRSNTVSAANPAARLTRPFDPLEDARQSRDTHGLPRRSGTERYRRRPYDESFTGAGRMTWESFEHVSPNARPEATRHESRPSRSEAKPFSRYTQPSTGAGFGVPDKVGECVRQLRDMGYGNRSPHEASRLSIYAAACNGDVGDAVEMIEEDRKAGRQHKDVGDKLGVRPFNHNDRPVFGR